MVKLAINAVVFATGYELGGLIFDTLSNLVR
jgi:hypothetical protein